MKITDEVAEAAWRAFLETQRASLLKRAGGPIDWMRGAIEAALAQVRAAGDVTITDSMAEQAWQAFLEPPRNHRKRQPFAQMRAALEIALAPEALQRLADADRALGLDYAQDAPMACDCDSPAWCGQHKACHRQACGFSPAQPEAPK